MNTRHEPDEWLMHQLATGTRECLETLVRRYASPLLTFIERMIGDRHRSEELFQEVFLAVWARRGQYQYPRPFRAWLYGIAINKCRADFRKRTIPRVSLIDDELSLVAPTPTPSPADTLIATETAALVAMAVGQLPPQQRVVVVLRTWNGLSYSQIAEIVGRSESTVRSNMHHGLAAMRMYLEPRLR